MGYLVLARKWRPRRFDDLVGQGPIVQMLANAIAQNKISHAYIFAGPRGVGKTTTARILAMCLNCAQGLTQNPCGVCPSCTSIIEGSSVDVLEIDGASNNSVDDIRDLRERVKYAASGGRHKVYIIDEAHMLSTSAFNALLKTLEEPPPHVVFVLATTEARKIPATVLSRCQHLPFRRVTMLEIKDRLRHIATTEGIGITDGALNLVARAADGSIRDSLTILDQVTSFAESVDEEDVKGLLDISDFGTLHDTAMACTSGDRAKVLGLIATLVSRGTDLRTFTRDLIKHFRDLLVCKVIKTDLEQAIDLTSEELARLKQAAEGLSEEHLALILTELIKAESEVKFASWPRVALEMSLLKISYLHTFATIKEAISALGQGSQKISEHTSVQPQPPSQAPALKMPSPRPPAAKKVVEERKPPVSAIIDEPPVEEPPLEDTETGEDMAPPALAPMDAYALLTAIIDRSDDNDRTASMLKPETMNATLEADRLSLTFTGPDAEIRAGSIKKNSAAIAKLASAIRGVPTKIEIHIIKSRPATPQVDMKTRVMADPGVKEAMSLFDGRIVDYKSAEE